MSGQGPRDPGQASLHLQRYPPKMTALLRYQRVASIFSVEKLARNWVMECRCNEGIIREENLQLAQLVDVFARHQHLKQLVKPAYRLQ